VAERGVLASAPNRIANRKLKSLTPDISTEHSPETLRRDMTLWRVQKNRNRRNR
jgi:hypothetical protein